MMKDGHQRHGACPDCGAPAMFFYSEYRGGEWHTCVACRRVQAARNNAFRQEFARRFPTLPTRVMMTLQRNFADQGMPALLAASDDDLLCGRQFGKGMLIEFRAVWPEPMIDIATADPWRDHAEMVAGVR